MSNSLKNFKSFTPCLQEKIIEKIIIVLNKALCVLIYWSIMNYSVGGKNRKPKQLLLCR